MRPVFFDRWLLNSGPALSRPPARRNGGSGAPAGVRALALFLGVLMLIASALVGATERTLILGVYAFRPKPVMVARYQPLADHLGRQLGDTRVELRILDQTAMEAALALGELDLIFTNPSHYLILRARNRLTGALATQVDLADGMPADRLGGVILTRADRDDITRLTDLRDRVIAIPGAKHLGGYQAQAYELLEAGLSAADDLRLLQVGGHDAVVEAVLTGRADAGFVRTGILESMARESSLDIRRLRVIGAREHPGFPYRASTRLYPAWPFVALPHVDARLTRRIASALFALESTDPAARAAGIDGFAPPADYQPVEQLARDLRLPPYDAPPAFTLADLWQRHAPAILVAAGLLLVLIGGGLVLARQNRRLRQARQRFSTLFEESPEPMWILVDGRFLDCNRAALSALGHVDRRAVLGHSPADLSPARQPDGEDSTGKAERLLTAAAEGTIQFEWVHRRADGVPLYADVSLTPIRIDGRAAILCVWHDITERKRAETALHESEARFRQFFEKNHSVMLMIEPASGVILGANHAAAKFYGYPREVLSGMPIERINMLPPAEIAAERARALSEERNYFNFPHRLADGEIRDVEVYSTPVVVAGQRILFTIVHDITERKRAEARLRLAASVFTHAREGILITDADNRIVEANDACLRITGYSREELLGATPGLFKSGRQTSEFYAGMWRALAEQGYWNGEIWNRRRDGEIYAELLTVSVVRDDSGRIRHHVALFTDITPIKRHQRQLERVAHHDALTGLPNRILLADRLDQAMRQARRQGRLLAVAYLDLDGFKAINDAHGHGVGDELLIQLARRMEATLREDDTLARVGGDEFVAVLAGLDGDDDWRPVLDRLLRAASEPVRIGGIEARVSASLGVTLYPRDPGDAEQLLRHADAALYQAKQDGRNRYRLFDGTGAGAGA